MMQSRHSNQGANQFPIKCDQYAIKSKTLNQNHGKLFFKTPEQGAKTSIFVATSPSLDNVSGEYFANCKPGKIKPWAKDDVAAERLWEIS